MKVSAITKQQWVSVFKNAIIAGIVAFGTALQVSGNVNKTAVVAALTAGGVAIVKTVEKAFTQG